MSYSSQKQKSLDEQKNNFFSLNEEALSRSRRNAPLNSEYVNHEYQSQLNNLKEANKESSNKLREYEMQMIKL